MSNAEDKECLKQLLRPSISLTSSYKRPKSVQVSIKTRTRGQSNTLTNLHNRSQSSGSIHLKQNSQTNIIDFFTQKDKEIKKLEYLCQNLQQSVSKRDTLSKEYFEQLCKVQDQNKQLTNQINKLKEENENLQKTLSQIQGKYQKQPQPHSNHSKKFHQGVENSNNGNNDSKQNNISSFFLNKRNTLLISEGTSTINNNLNNSKTLFESFANKTFQLQQNFLTNPSIHLTQRRKHNKKWKNDAQMKTITVTKTQGKKDLNSIFLGHSGILSALQMKESDAQSVIESEQLLNLQNLLSDDDFFVNQLQSMDFQASRQVIETIRQVLYDFKNFMNTIITLKKLLKATQTFSGSLLFDEAMDRIPKEACEILQCDRASIFLIDRNAQQLWTRVAKGAKNTIRIPINQGIVGFVAQKGIPVRIHDAYLDPRFNQEVDQRNNYRTKTILAVPILDLAGQVQGVCQAINKFNGKFTPDDEEYFKLLATSAGLVLKNSIYVDSALLHQHRLIRLQKLGSNMLSTRTLTQLFKKAENVIREVFGSNISVIYVYDEKLKEFYTIDSQNQKHSYSLKRGIAGYTIQQKKYQDISSPLNHDSYDKYIDLDSEMPIICMPIFSCDQQPEKVIGVFEAKNIKSLGQMMITKSNMFELEIINQFCEQLSICIQNILDTTELKRNSTANNKFIQKQDSDDINSIGLHEVNLDDSLIVEESKSKINQNLDKEFSQVKQKNKIRDESIEYNSEQNLSLAHDLRVKHSTSSTHKQVGVMSTQVDVSDNGQINSRKSSYFIQ